MLPLRSAKVVTWISERRFVDEVCLTAVNVAEILYGIQLLPEGKRRERLRAAADSMFAEDFADKILPFEESAARVFGELVTMRRSQGRPISQFDAQIAAIAKVNMATIATRNTSDFEGCGIRLVNPWVD